MILRAMFLTTVTVSLAACGGSSGGGASYDELLQDYENTINAGFESDAEIATFASLQAAGSATYSGQSAIFLNVDELEAVADVDAPSDLPEPTLLGQINLQTSFGSDAGTISGSMSRFVDSNENAKSGTIDVFDGVIAGDDDGNGLVFLFEGDLNGAGAGSRSYQGGAYGAISDDGDLVAAGLGGSLTDGDTALTLDTIETLNPEYVVLITANEN